METTSELVITWRKSSFSSGNGGACVEVGSGAPAVLVRDTKNRPGGTLAFPSAAWRAFLTVR